MMRDLSTMVWKELRELVLPRRGAARTLRNLLLQVTVFGVVLPLQFGRAWVQSAIPLLLWAWVPLFLVVAVIADAFAGERERHTLETLLATRLPDRAILFGKIAAGVIHGGGISLACFLVGLVTTSVAQRQVVVPRPWVAAGVGASMLLGALAAASGGVLVSLRAGTVRQVQQTLSVVMMAVLFLPPLAGQLLPEETRRALAARLATLGPEVLFVLALVALAFLDAALLGAAMRRFRRARLGASLS